MRARSISILPFVLAAVVIALPGKAYAGDISIEPIPADEPLAGPGFPPMPDRVDLPVTLSSYSGGGSSGGGGSSPSGNSAGPNISSPNLHQHYRQMSAEDIAKMQGKMPSVGGGGGSSSSGSSNAGYKCQTYQVPTGKEVKPDSYFVNTKGGATAAAPSFSSPAQHELDGLGKEPKLGPDGSAPEEKPKTVIVHQATTQDLSLPDDDFETNKKKEKKEKKNGGSKITKFQSGMQRTIQVPMMLMNSAKMMQNMK